MKFSSNTKKLMIMFTPGINILLPMIRIILQCYSKKEFKLSTYELDMRGVPSLV